MKKYLHVCDLEYSKGGVKPPMEVTKMVSLERFNKQDHKYIYSIRWCSGVDCGYAVSGCIGTRFYMMYPLKEVIKRYNADARSREKC